jgi:hypothetical protein
MDVDILCCFCEREGHIAKECADANDEQKNDLLKLKWKEWKVENAKRTASG